VAEPVTPTPTPPPLTAEEVKAKKAKAAKRNYLFKTNPLIWGYLFLAEHFRDAPAEFHKEIIAAAMKYDKLAVAAPRSHAKSTILSFLYVLHAIYYNRKRFICIFSNTKEKAANFLDRIKAELQENEMLQMYYGDVEFSKDTQYDIVIRFRGHDNIRVICRGEDGIQNIRGEIKGAWRPDLIILDDVEYQDLVDSPDRRLKLKNDFNQALLPAGDIKTCQYIAIGTILHFDALIANLVSKTQYTDWHKLFYKAVIDEATQETLWAEHVPFSYLMHIKDTDPVTFAKEYQNNPISGEQARFKPENFRYFTDTSNTYTLLSKEGMKSKVGNYSDCLPAIACDLAWSTRKTADYTVLMSILLDPDGNYLVYNYKAERGMRPDRFATLLFEQVQILHKLTSTRPAVGFEKAMLERVSQHLLKNEMRRRNEYFVIKDLKWESDKISRIEVALEAKYSNNIIYHRHGMGSLEDELIQFPYSSHDDICDSLAGAVGMLKFSKNIKSKGLPQSDDPMFDWVRENMMPQGAIVKSKRAGEFLFGKTSNYSIPAKKSFMAN